MAQGHDDDREALPAGARPGCRGVFQRQRGGRGGAERPAARRVRRERQLRRLAGVRGVGFGRVVLAHGRLHRPAHADGGRGADSAPGAERRQGPGVEPQAAGLAADAGRPSGRVHPEAGEARAARHREQLRGGGAHGPHGGHRCRERGPRAQLRPGPSHGHQAAKGVAGHARRAHAPHAPPARQGQGAGPREVRERLPLPRRPAGAVLGDLQLPLHAGPGHRRHRPGRRRAVEQAPAGHDVRAVEGGRKRQEGR